MISTTNNGITLSSIVAIAENYVIGKDNGMIWHVPEDLKHFKRTTMGKPIIMGRKSYESLGKPLPGRPNIVVSRSYKDLPAGEPSQIFKDMEAEGEMPHAPEIGDGPFLFASIEDGIKAARHMAKAMNVDEIFITGGGEIYRQTLPYTDRLYLTVLHRAYEGDTSFPKFDWNDWKIVSEKPLLEGDPPLTFFTLERL